METISGATFAFFQDGAPDLIENDLTRGSYRVMVGQAPVSEGPPMHIHPHTDEGFYIADGEMVFVFPDREVVAGPNTFVFVPRGCVHTARTTQTTRGLLIYSPGGAEHVTKPVEPASG
jgi:mannose-6-phosphate isomerase-like protein (cupin superfamily)